MSGWSRTSWDKLSTFPIDEYPADHPWPPGTPPDLRVYSYPLGCEHHVFSISRYRPGDSIEHHRHEIAEEIYVLMSGAGRIRIDDEVVDAKPLDAFRVPPEALRSVVNHTDEDAWWLVIGAPADEFGYLK
jgi:quercetin dioxygenase-like cupin family protein